MIHGDKHRRRVRLVPGAGSIRRAHSHPLLGKSTVVLKVTGEPGSAVACWLATTTPLQTNSRVPVRLGLRRPRHRHRHTPGRTQLDFIPRGGVPLTTKLTNSLRPLRETTVRPTAMP